MIGRSLGHYEIVERVGAGGMGDVYRARDTKLDRDVAIKTLPDDLADDRARLARLRREARLLAALNHPNIATIHDLSEVDGTVFLVLELLEGDSLHERLEDGPLEVAEALDVARQIAEALEAAHDKGIIHRDLKPSNVMLLARGRVKVLDFGIGKALGLGESVAATLEGSVDPAGLGTGAGDPETATGGLVGTVPYISPEQIRGEAVDQRADIWAFGCVLYELLTGRRAFPRETVADTLAAIVEAEPDWSRLPAETPGPVVRSLKRMLQKSPDQRARDMWHLRLELGDALRESHEGGELACPDCGKANPVRNRFCSGCGTRLRRECPDCGEQVASGAVFCGNCGSSLSRATTGAGPGGAGADDRPTGRIDGSGGPARRDVPSDPLLEGERRHATVVCSTLGGYHELVEAVGPDRADHLLGRIREQLEEVAERHDGLVNRFTGDELVVLFGVPVAHEEDPLRAVRTAFELHRGVGELVEEVEDELGDRSAIELRLRTAIDSGSVLFQQVDGSEPYRLSGEPLQLAGALRGQARDDEILLSPRCARLIGPGLRTERRDPVTLQGQLMRPYTALTEVDVGSPVDATGPGGLTPYSGRDPELRQIEERLEQALAGEGQLVNVVAEAGAGKSRLLHEFRRVCLDREGGEAQVLQGRCQATGHGVPYLPFLGALRQCLGLDARVVDPSGTAVESVREIDPDLEGFVPFYLEFLSIPSEDHPMPERMEGDDFRLALQEALAALFTLAARRRPTVMLLEDWHWADESSEDLLLQIAGMVSAYPLLVVVTYRPERTFDWGRVASPTSIRLGPLDRAASAAIIQSVLEVDDVSAELVDLIHERTGGNPFFLEEICRTLEEEGSVTVRDGRATAAATPERLHLPDTVQAVIRSRLDRIDRRARDVLRVASVVGREFSRRILEHTVGGDEAELGSILEELKGLGLIQQLRVLPDRAYRFNHALTQEVTYESLLQHQRKRLHGIVGEAIEELYPERIDEHLDRLARHFSRAEEWEKAVAYGMRAADRYSTLSQFPEARKMLEETERWLSRTPASPDRQERLVELLLQRERVGEHLGDASGQEAAIERLLEILEPAGESPELAEVTLRRGELLTLRRQFDAAEEALTRSLRISRTLGDEVAERRALRSMGFLHWQQGDHDRARSFAERALEIGRRLEDPKAVVTDLSNLASVLRSAGLSGPRWPRGPGKRGPRPRLGAEVDVAREGEADTELLEEAQTLIEEALEVAAEEIPLSMERASAMWIAAGVFSNLGDDERAVRLLEEAHDLARRQRFPHHQHLQMIALANHYWSQGRIEESLEHYEKAVTIARRFHATHGLSESLRALGEAFLTLQRTDEAIPHLEECAELFARLGDREAEAVTRANLATAHEQRGDDDAAAGAWEEVLRLRRAMGDRGGEVKALEGIGRALRGTDPDVARSHLTAALELSQELGDAARQADLHNSLGILEWRRDGFEEALQHYERALDLLEEIGDPRHCGLVLNSMGVVLKELGRRAEAKERLEKARRLNRESGATLLEAHSLAVLADLAAEVAPEEAARLYEESLALRRRAGDRRGAGWMLLGLARVTSAQDDIEAARGHLREAQRIAREVDDPELDGACGETSEALPG